MDRRTRIRRERDAIAYETFGEILGYCSVGAIIASWWFGSIIPVIIAGIGLFGLLGFCNGVT